MFGLDKIYWIFINSVFAFVFLFIISKLLGKKQIAQLEFIDYAVGISLGSIAAEWSVEAEEPFYYYAISMAIFFALAYLTAVVGRKTPLLKRIFKGKPITLIYEGKISFKGLCKSHIDVNDLLAMLREKGYFDVADVAYAIFETSGKLSVLPKGDQRPVVVEDLGDEKVKQASLTNTLVIDGEISKSGLNELEKDVPWLLKRLKIENKKDLQDIILATYDDETKKINVHYKSKSV